VIEASRRRIELQSAILEHLPDAKVVVDETGVIVLINAQTELMFGYHRSELVGQKVEILLAENEKEPTSAIGPPLTTNRGVAQWETIFRSRLAGKPAGSFPSRSCSRRSLPFRYLYHRNHQATEAVLRILGALKPARAPLCSTPCRQAFAVSVMAVLFRYVTKLGYRPSEKRFRVAASEEIGGYYRLLGLIVF
jgi:hypothetical protein